MILKDFNFSGVRVDEGPKGFSFFGTTAEPPKQPNFFSSNLTSSRNGNQAETPVRNSTAASPVKEVGNNVGETNSEKLPKESTKEIVVVESQTLVENTLPPKENSKENQPKESNSPSSPPTMSKTVNPPQIPKDTDNVFKKPSQPNNGRFQKPKPIVFNKPTVNSPLMKPQTPNPNNSSLQPKKSPPSNNQERIKVIQHLSKQPVDKRVREDVVQQTNDSKKRKVSTEFEDAKIGEILKGTQLDEDIECSMMEIKSKESEFITTLEEVALQMHQITECLREKSVDLLVLSNNLLMMNDPILSGKIEELSTKYGHLCLDL